MIGSLTEALHARTVPVTGPDRITWVEVARAYTAEKEEENIPEVFLCVPLLRDIQGDIIIVIFVSPKVYSKVQLDENNETAYV